MQKTSAPLIRSGGNEELLLRVVSSLNGEAYAVNIQEAIQEETGREIPVATIYVTLDRLENKELVESSWTEPTAERGGRRKQVFRITGLGESTLREIERSYASVRKAFPVSG